jgi:hypothetical protein
MLEEYDRSARRISIRKEYSLFTVIHYVVTYLMNETSAYFESWKPNSLLIQSCKYHPTHFCPNDINPCHLDPDVNARDLDPDINLFLSVRQSRG